MLPGGGIGPELMNHVREVFHFAGVPVDFEVIDINPSTTGNEDLEYAIMSIKRNGVAIKGKCNSLCLTQKINQFRFQVTLKPRARKPMLFHEMWRYVMS